MATHSPYLIAEAGVNHNGSLDMACQLIDAAKAAGADAVKFQTFIADALVSQDAPQATYQQHNTGTNESQLEMVKKLELGFDQFRQLKRYCDQVGITFLSTPFDEASADFLASLDIAAFKIPSGEVTNHPFLQHIARKGKPMYFSTGMSYLSEVDEALRAIYATGNRQVTLLHCVSNYPAAPEDINLRAMHTLHTAFHLPVGYSDHTDGIEIALAAAAMGACVIEKHFTLDRTLPGPDHMASLEPPMLAEMVQQIRRVTQALGDGIKRPMPSEANTMLVARRSLVAACSIAAGTTITPAMLTAKRPSTGLSPAMSDWVIGRQTRIDIPSGAFISLTMLQ